MTNLENILKSRDIILLTKFRVKPMFFPVVMYGCESWTIKKVECKRTDTVKLWCWRRLLIISWTARRSNQSILKKSTLNIHSKDWCWSWSSNTWATWCKELTHWKRPLTLGKVEGKRRRGWQKMKWLGGIVNSMDMSLSKLRDIVEDRGIWHAINIIHEVTKSQTRLNDWTELNQWI